MLRCHKIYAVKHMWVLVYRRGGAAVSRFYAKFVGKVFFGPLNTLRSNITTQVRALWRFGQHECKTCCVNLPPFTSAQPRLCHTWVKASTAVSMVIRGETTICVCVEVESRRCFDVCARSEGYVLCVHKQKKKACSVFKYYDRHNRRPFLAVMRV